MCCTGQGCPSWDCTLHGGGFCTYNSNTNECKWNKPFNCDDCQGRCDSITSGGSDSCSPCGGGGDGGTCYVNCKNVNISGAMDPSGNLIRGNTFDIAASYAYCRYDFPKHAIMAVREDTGIPLTCGTMVYGKDSPWTGNSMHYSWVPSAIGKYVIYCTNSNSGYNSCTGLKCKDSDISCAGPLKKRYVTVVDPPPPSCTVSGRPVLHLYEVGTYHWTAEGLLTNFKLLKSPTSGPSWTTFYNITPPKGTTTYAGTADVSFSAPGTYYIACQAASASEHCMATPFGSPDPGWLDCGNNSYMTVTVSPIPNSAPTCTIVGPDCINRDTTRVYTGIAADVDGTVDKTTLGHYVWSYYNGTTLLDTQDVIPNPDLFSIYAKTSWTYPVYTTLNLVVKDDNAATGSCSKAIKLSYSSCVNPPWCWITGPSSAPPGTAVSLISSSSDSSTGRVVSYSWSSTSGGTFVVASGTWPTNAKGTKDINPMTTSWTVPATPGSATAVLTVKDNAGNSAPCSFPINVLGNTYTLRVTVKDASPPSYSCASQGSSLSDATVTVSDPASLFSQTVNTGASGWVDIQVSTSITHLNVTANKSSTPNNYVLKCKEGAPASWNTAWDYVPADGSSQHLELGIGKDSTVPYWSVVLDGDIYATGILTSVPISGAKPNFSNYLINHLSSIGGIALSENTITNRSNVFETDHGAYAQSLGVSSKDISLNRFQFTVPSHTGVASLTLSGNPSISSTVNSAAVGDFNSWIGAGGQNRTYTIPSGKVAVLYLIGGGEVDFSHSLTTASGGGRLLIVTDSGVKISKDVGTNPAVYTADDNPNIMAGIIAKDNITFESGESSTDLPVMVTGPLVSKGAVELNRDLGLWNVSLPAQAVKYYPKFLYEISSAEYTNKDLPNYSGFRSFDVQFVFDDWNTF
jgi:hypothetical protein